MAVKEAQEAPVEMAVTEVTAAKEATLALEALAATGAMEATAEMAEKEAQEAPVETAATEATAEMAEMQVQEAQVAMEVTGAMAAILRIGHLERAATGRSRLEPPVKPRIICPLLQQRLQSLGNPHPIPQVVTLRQMKRRQS